MESIRMIARKSCGREILYPGGTHDYAEAYFGR